MALVRRYLRRFPPGARSLATSNWYFSFDDHRAPHDAWLLSVVFEEIAAGARHDERAVSLRLRLRGAYHDHELEFCYPKVFAYTFQGRAVAFGHGDWRYDEFRLDQAGHSVHEIQWYGMGELAIWVITADDVIFTSRKVSSATR